MRNVSTNFIEASLSPVGYANAYIEIGETRIDASNITDITITSDLGGSYTIGSFNTAEASMTIVSEALPNVVTAQPIKIYFGYYIASTGEYEYVPMGVFYAEPRDVSHKNLLTTIKAHDQSWAMVDKFTTSLTYPTKVSNVLAEIQTALGLTYGSYGGLAPSSVNVYEAPVGAYRDVIAQMALLMGTNAKLNRSGALDFIKVMPSTPVQDYGAYDYTADNYQLSSDQPMAYGVLTVNYTHEVTTGEGEEQETTEVTDTYTYEAPSGSHGITIDTRNIRSQAETNTLGASVLGDGVSYYGYTATLPGQPHIDLGDTIELTEPLGDTYEFLVLSVTHQFNGAMKSTFSASISDSEPTIDGGNLFGSLTDQVSTISNALGRQSRLLADTIAANTAEFNTINANKANISDLNAQTARIDNLQATKADITDLNAEKARIDTLEANEAVINDTLTATNAHVEYLESDWISTDRLVLTGNNKNNYPPVEITQAEFNANKTAYYTKSGDTYTQCTTSSVYNPNTQYYVKQTVKSIIEAINTANNTDPQIVVSNDKLIAASMDVAELSAITANMGTLTAGKIQKGNNFINFNTSPASMEFKNASTWANATQGIRFDTQGNLAIKGTVNVTSGNIYSKTEADNLLGAKANSADVYTKSDFSITPSAIIAKVSATETALAGMYAVSSTASGTTAKVATITPSVTGWTLYKGATISVKFTTANTATAPTLNINSTGAKAIRTYNGGTLSESEYKWKAGTTFAFVYDGTYWRMQDSTVYTSIQQNADNITATIVRVGSLETYIRAYGSGVLVGKTSQTIGALVNASGSFDVVPVSWSGSTPTVGSSPYASFGTFTRVGLLSGSHIELGSTNGMNVFDQDGLLRMNASSTGISVFDYAENDTTPINVAQFGTTARLGARDSSRFMMNAKSLQAYDDTNSKYFEVSATGMSYGAHTVANTSDVATAKSQAISTASADATSKASTAESNAKTYADGVASTAEDNASKIATNFLYYDSTIGLKIAQSNPSTATTSYIQIASNGMKTALDANNYTVVTSSGFDVHKGGNSVALFGDNVRVGANADGKSRVEISSDGIEFKCRVNSSTTWSLANIEFRNAYGNNTIAKSPTFTFGVRGSGSYGQYSFVVGSSNIASELLTTAFGLGTSATETGAFAEGWSTTASGKYSHAEGYMTTAGSDYQHVMGKYNLNSSSNAFEIGNGTSSAPSNIFTVGWNGNLVASGTIKGTGWDGNLDVTNDLTVGGNIKLPTGTSIGTYRDATDTSTWMALIYGNASGEIHIGNEKATNTILKSQLFVPRGSYIMSGSSTTNSRIVCGISGTNTYMFGYGSRNSSEGASYFDGHAVYVRSNGNISFTAGSSGTISGNKAYTNTSDIRLKTDIEELDTDDIILKLKPFKYHWKDEESFDADDHYGVSAQELQKLLKKKGIGGIVTKTDEYLGVAYSELIPMLIHLCQSQQREIDDLKEKLQ